MAVPSEGQCCPPGPARLIRDTQSLIRQGLESLIKQGLGCSAPLPALPARHPPAGWNYPIISPLIDVFLVIGDL